MSTPAPRILVIRRRYLGDLVLLGSVFRNLRLHWPDATLSLLAEPGYASIAALNPDVTESLTFPRRLAEWPRLLRRLRQARFTHVLDFDNTDKTAWLTRWTGAIHRVTYDRETNPFRHRWAYTASAPVTNACYTSQHITETYLALLQPIGVPVVSREVRLVPRADDLRFAEKLTGGPRSKTESRKSKVLLHPGSRSPFRLWPAARFAAICDRLQDELGVQVFVVAGPAEAALVREIRQHAQAHLVAIEQRLTTGQFAALLAQFDLLLCHDSGPMHIAAAVGVPVVALFGSQNATIWRPVGGQHTVLQTALPCTCLPDLPAPCVQTDSYRSYCVRQLGVDEVYAALRRQLVPQN
ncbi:MAG: glycosyltransferase family 9 protein [Opitutaceae bacterium]|nr:glycosyltransferase family 9 protein [Opitutaceae bacterium]